MTLASHSASQLSSDGSTYHASDFMSPTEIHVARSILIYETYMLLIPVLK